MIVYLMAGVGFVLLAVVAYSLAVASKDDDIPRPPRR